MNEQKKEVQVKQIFEKGLTLEEKITILKDSELPQYLCYANVVSVIKELEALTTRPRKAFVIKADGTLVNGKRQDEYNDFIKTVKTDKGDE